MEIYILQAFNELHFCLMFISTKTLLKIQYKADRIVLLILIFWIR